MDPFVRRLVERLFEPGSPLSRNRHFHTFENPEGRRALKIRRRLLALEQAVADCRAQGGAPRVERREADDGAVTVALHLHAGGVSRTTWLEEDEFELLQRLPGVARALSGSEPV